MSLFNRFILFICFICILLLSLWVKLSYSKAIIFDFDIVPVVSLGWDFLQGGAFPAHGTLSSVAAYNLPFLVWLHLPLLAITQDSGQAILLTLIFFNLLGTSAIFAVARQMFGWRVAIIAGVLFTFGNTSLSASSIAWAQLLLPSFYALVLFFLWRWIKQGGWLDLTLCGMIATAAFMTHFSAIILYPVMFVLALLGQARWRWQGLFFGALGCGLMFMPYIAFQIPRQFTDLRAFLSRDVQVPDEVMVRYAYLQTVSSTASNTSVELTLTPIEATPTSTNPHFIIRLQQEFTAIRDLPYNVFRFMPIADELALLSQVCILIALVSSAWAWLKQRKTLPHSIDGRILMIGVFIGVYLGVMFMLRVYPASQPTYLVGLETPIILLVAVGLERILCWVERVKILAISAICVGFIVLSVTSRANLLQQRETTLVPQVWYYHHIEALTDWIAQDWQTDTAPNISYDIISEQGQAWWVIPWNTIDSDYRMGMSFDFLLRENHQIINANQDPIGIAENPDYIVIYDVGLERYDSTQYEIHTFGRILVLKPHND
jgi:hypothetical protein